jgi:hypothetical protein
MVSKGHFGKETSILPLPTGVSPDTHVFRLEGEYWTIAYEGALLRLRDAKGLRYVAHLLHHPGEWFSAVELLRTGRGIPDGGAGVETESGGSAIDPVRLERARSAVTKRIRAALAKIRSHHPPLGRYLLATIKTGQTCAYLPDDAARWDS